MTKFNALLTISFCLALSGCGFETATDSDRKITKQAERDPSDDIKRTTAGMDEMADQIRRANEGMDRMSEQVRKTNESIEKMSEKMIEHLKKANEELAKLLAEQLKKSPGSSGPGHGPGGPIHRNEGGGENKATHLQTLAVALAEMTRPENTRVLSPPSAMMPAGQIFASEATAEEIVKLAHAYLKDDDEVRVAVVAVVSGLAPQETVDEIVRSQIESGGRYEEAAYAVLLMRYSFIHDVLLRDGVFARPLSSLGLLTEAVRLAELLHMIAALPFAEEMLARASGGAIAPSVAATRRFDRETTRTVWRRIDGAIDTELSTKYKTKTNERILAALRARVRDRLRALQPASGLTIPRIASSDRV